MKGRFVTNFENAHYSHLGGAGRKITTLLGGNEYITAKFRLIPSGYGLEIKKPEIGRTDDD